MDANREREDIDAVRRRCAQMVFRMRWEIQDDLLIVQRNLG
jgi:hypothetical protein